MRPASILASVLCSIAAVAAVASPQPGGVVRLESAQVSRRELQARAHYPEHFEKRTWNHPSGTPPPPCPMDQNHRNNRRGLVTDQVLQPREAVAFLKGRGMFTTSNGTTYIDEDFMDLMEKGAARAESGFASRLYTAVKTKLGKTLLTVTVPYYKKWKSTLAHGDVFWLSSKSYIRHEDVEEIERILLEDPEFTELEVHGYHITRSFFEAAAAY